MAEGLTKKQTIILEYIKSVVMDKGYPPSVREIGEAVGLKSTSTVHGHLTRLEEKGYIRRDPTKPRAIEILDPEDSLGIYKNEVLYVPVVGNVTAGTPILAVENIEEKYPVPKDFMNEGDTYFMLQVKGESMIKAGILDKDYILIKQQSDAINGDIVVALLDDSATVKTFYKEKDNIRLQPENDTMDPIYTKDASILGLVKGVFRRM
ncbi:MAG: transcriptional repressor LexA [Firmicutes bacterium]|jgi:repressor LexA|nr:transcriptional repressor LexA [Bacillota bacterium]